MLNLNDTMNSTVLETYKQRSKLRSIKIEFQDIDLTGLDLLMTPDMKRDLTKEPNYIESFFRKVINCFRTT
jgi:hypothetical protein